MQKGSETSLSPFRFNSTKSKSSQDDNAPASINDDDDDDQETPKSCVAGRKSEASSVLHKSFINGQVGTNFIKNNGIDDSQEVHFFDGITQISVTTHQAFLGFNRLSTKLAYDPETPKASFCGGASSLCPKYRDYFVQSQLEEETSSSSDEYPLNVNNEPGILRFADQEDALKSFRGIQMRKMTELPNEMAAIPEEDKEVSPNLPQSGSLGKEPVFLESLGSLRSLEPSSYQGTPMHKRDSSDESSMFGDHSHKTSITDESPNQQGPSETKVTINFKNLFQKSIKTVWKKEGAQELPTIQGYLDKRSTQFLHMWQKRYVVVNEKKLIYYKNETLDQICGCLDFDLFCARVEIDSSNPKKFTIFPFGGTTSFSFKADSKDEAKKWNDTIKAHIAVSEGAKCKLNSIAPKKNFWKNARISEAKFLAESKTGDLLLFKSQNLTAILQRSVTRSEYDHVGMILRDRHGNIILFEATGNEGVGLCRWTTFKHNNWHTLYKKVIYRKLCCERTKDFIEKAEKFVKNTLGKKYSISAKKLLTKSVASAVDAASEVTFFCSELIAACYQKLGLLPNSVPASNYLPGAFAAERKLDLSDGAKLGEEYLIDFNL